MRARGLVLAGMVGTLAAGCATSPPGFGAWQRGLERYVAEQGAGDPAVLRHLPLRRSTQTERPARVVFGVLDVPSARRWFAPTCDVQGELLGVPAIEGRRWYCFVVGQVRCRPWSPPEIQDVRLAAFAVGEDGWAWRMSPRQEDVVAAYRRGRGAADVDGGSLVRRASVDRGVTADLGSAEDRGVVGDQGLHNERRASGDHGHRGGRAAFPAAGDLFELAVDAAMVTARDVRTGAVWQLDLGAASPPRSEEP